MAKIKIKLGENEIEIDSRDFYVDNYSIGEVIETITKYIPQSNKVIHDESSKNSGNSVYYSSMDQLKSLEDAEIHEPEFTEPVLIDSIEIKGKLQMLAHTSFFDEPRTVEETVSQLREYGWIASPLDVSKGLAKMAMNKEILKNSQENRCYYFLKDALLAN